MYRGNRQNGECLPDCCHGYKGPPHSLHRSFSERPGEMFGFVSHILEKEKEKTVVLVRNLELWFGCGFILPISHFISFRVKVWPCRR